MQHFYSFVSQPALLVCTPVGHVAFLFISQVCHWWCPPLDAGHVAFLYLSPRLVTGGVRPFPLFLFICLPGLSLPVSALSAGHAAFLFISQVCHCWCPAGHVAFLFVCLPACTPGVHPRWSCSISILLSPRSVAGVSLSIGHEAFLFICLPGPSLLVPCSISIYLSFRSVTVSARVRWP